MIEITENPILHNKEIRITNVRRIIIAKIDGVPDTVRSLQVQTDMGTELLLALIPETGKEIEVI